MADAPPALRAFHLHSDQLVELPRLPAELPAKGFVWAGSAARRWSRRGAVRDYFAQRLAQLGHGRDLRGASRLPTSPADP